ncbi:MAG: tetratricopeptide repeat protein [Polyangiaceae bacterium]
MRVELVASLIFLACGCGHAASPADSIALGPSKSCTEGVWDGIECATPHAEKNSDDEDTSGEATTDRTTAKVEPCEDDDCDDAPLDHAPSSDSDFMTEGLAAYNARDYMKARKLFYELISKHPNSPHVGDAYFWFGKMFEEEGRKDPMKLQLAAQSFIEAEKFPKATQGPAAMLELGLVYMQLGETSKANLQFAQLRKRFPGSAAATKIPPGH